MPLLVLKITLHKNPGHLIDIYTNIRLILSELKKVKLDLFWWQWPILLLTAEVLKVISCSGCHCSESLQLMLQCCRSQMNFSSCICCVSGCLSVSDIMAWSKVSINYFQNNNSLKSNWAPVMIQIDETLNCIKTNAFYPL